MTTAGSRAASTYRNVNIDSRVQHDQYQLVVMMFETTMECLAMARGAIEQNDTELKVRKISQAIRIVQEGLRTSLDLENGGELARNLASLYDYCAMRMTQANAANDAKALEEVADLIRPVAEAWLQMRKTSATQSEESNTAASSRDDSQATRKAAVTGMYAAFNPRMGSPALAGA